MDIYTDFRPKHINDFWYVVASSEESKELKIAKIPHWIRHPKAVAIAIADSLNKNSKLQLVDLV